MEASPKRITAEELSTFVSQVMNETPIVDMHTHLYSEEFGDIGLWGVDELINYHYLIAENFRFSTVTYEQFWAMDKARQAEVIWKNLFQENSPVSEATRGVLTALQMLGLNTARPSLREFRDYFQEQNRRGFTDKVLKLANVKCIVMTNDPFDPTERVVWLRHPEIDPRFKAVLRLDPLLVKWPKTCPQLSAWGYDVHADMGNRTISEVRRFLEDWVRIMHPVYMAVSLPPEFRFPDETPCSQFLSQCVLPVCREHGLPFSIDRKSVV